MCTTKYEIETFAIETENEKSKNIILNVIYRHPNGDLKVSEDYFNDFFFYNPLKIIFQLSLEKGIFSDDLKTAKVTPVFKGGDPSKLQKYIPISVLPCFSKIFDYIIYNCF